LKVFILVILIKNKQYKVMSGLRLSATRRVEQILYETPIFFYQTAKPR